MAGWHAGRMQNSLYPSDLTDEQWELLQMVLPPIKAAGTRGRPPADRRRLCNGLLYFVRAGCAWRLLPRDFGPWQTVYHYFALWTRQGCWQVVHDVLRDAETTARQLAEFIGISLNVQAMSSQVDATLYRNRAK